MAGEGAAVVVNYRVAERAAHEVVRGIENIGGTAIAVQGDVVDYGQVKAMVDRAIRELGKVDILVSNAGVDGPGKALSDTPPEEFLTILHTHLVGAYNSAHVLLPHMRTYGRADIQFISSINADSCPPSAGVYNAAKSGIEALAKGLAKEERYNGIRVNAIGPGLVETDMTRPSIVNTTGVTDVGSLDARMPLGRLVRPDDIGQLCVFLASEAGSHISGEVIYVRGAVGAEPAAFYLSGPQKYTTYRSEP
jgi:NAD(P)-dependent dehydrogenase (short-subunit alcohol dehydrogenase family)